VYPTCVQTRFDHTIGVTILGNKFFDFLISKDENKNLMSSEDKKNLILACILHDIGHGFLSHISEAIYKNIEYFKKAKKNFEKSMERNFEIKEHEFLSYKIVTSESFKKFLEKLGKKYRFSYNIDNISGFIIGKTKNSQKQYLAEILNGTLDVDKLDYMKRDAYFLGINLPVEIEQIMYRTKIKTDGNTNKLAINVKGIHNIDQLIFNRAFFYSTVYFHHKIRAATCMIKALFEFLQNNNLQINNLNFKKVTHFLSITDQELLSHKSPNSDLNKFLQQIQNRKLYKRILEICPSFIENFNENIEAWKKFQEEAKENLDKMRENFANELNNNDFPCQKYEIWVDVYEIPELQDLLPEVWLSENNYLDYSEIFDANGFFENYFTGSSPNYGEIKLKTYIFGKSENKFRRYAADKLKRYIENQYGIKLKPSANSKIIE